VTFGDLRDKLKGPTGKKFITGDEIDEALRVRCQFCFLLKNQHVGTKCIFGPDYYTGFPTKSVVRWEKLMARTNKSGGWKEIVDIEVL
jgi:hypothetical protein